MLLLRDAIENLEIGGLLVSAVEKWTADQLFAESFLDKVKEATSTIVAKMQEERAGGGKH